MTDLHIRLLALPALIETQERAVLDAIVARNTAREALDTAEAILILQGDAGAITGRNEATRKAQLFTHTVRERNAVEAADVALMSCQISLRRVRDEMSALRAVVRGSCDA